MIRLFYNYYQTNNHERQAEIDTCLRKNLENKHIHVVVLERSEKPTYNYLFGLINKITCAHDVNIICNSDIYFDESIKLAENLLPESVYTLCRWEITANGESKFSNRPDSQDTWIIRGRVRDVFGDFTLGSPGCDNRIAYEFQKSGYTLENPARQIKTYHLHCSNVRTYSRSDTVPEPHLTVHPTELRFING